MDPFQNPVFAIITGANRGYGYAIAEALLPKLCAGSVMVLSGRNEKQLECAQKTLKSKQNENQGIVLKLLVADFSNEQDLVSFMDHTLEGLSSHTFTSSILFNNAGTLGDVNVQFDMQKDYGEISKYMDTNVTSTMFLTAQFLQRLSKHCTCFVIHISSLCAIQAFRGMSLYCAGKSARDMMFRVLAEERKDVRVLNWAPGPMPTAMMDTLSCINDPITAKIFQDLKNNKTYVECSASASKLIMLIQNNSFNSGAHIDFYDV